MRIAYLQLASSRGTESRITEDRIRQLGESIRTVSTPFQLIPQFRKIRLENG
jgi:hypothetical protein